MTEETGESSHRTPIPGSIFGPYTIVDSLGAGGMGEVFRAHDAKLNRDVALKFLPEVLSSDKQLLARFEREAELLARVNHPNIATIHSIEDDGGQPFLVLELVGGETLKKMLASGSLPLRDALRVCRDIAFALEAAHRKGIVHRDLKPANVMVTEDGLVKVLDFGIAKRLEQSRADDLTSTGMVVGTGPYIPPEQIRGKPSGRRGDIWTFGCVLFEALTGVVAFGRDDLADTMTSILGQEPDWRLLPATTPESVRRLLERCLRKDPSERLQAIGDARIEIDDAIRGGPQPGSRPDADTIPRWKLVAGAAAILAVGIMAGALAAFLSGPRGGPPLATPTYYDLALPSNVVLGLGGAPSIAISRDGSRYAAVLHDGISRRLYRRDSTQSPEWIDIPGTEGAEGPFFSWNGSMIGFFAGSELRVVPFDGGQPETVTEALEPHGGAWAEDGAIYYSANESLWETHIDRRGEIVEEVDRELGLRWPLILPDGETVVYTSWFGADSRRTALKLRRAGGDVSVLAENAGYARYSPSQHIVFTRDDGLWALPFGPNSLTSTGQELPLPTAVLVREDVGVPFFALAAEGTLVHAPSGGGVLTPGPVLAWMDSTQQSVPEPEPLETYHETLMYPRLSADGSKLAVSYEEAGDSQDEDIVHNTGIVQLAEGGNLESIVAGGMTYAPEWSPDDTLAYLAIEEPAIYAKRAYTGGSGDQLVGSESFPYVPTGWSATGLLFFTRYSFEDLSRQVYYLDTRSNDATPQAFFDTEYEAYSAVPSPSGDVVAYVRRAAGDEETEVMVVSFADRIERTVSSGTDCQEPMWSADGSTLFFRCDTRMMASDIQRAPLEPNNRRELWNWPFALDDQLAKANYAYDPVSKRFLMVSEEPVVTATVLKVVSDWAWIAPLRGSEGR